MAARLQLTRAECALLKGRLENARAIAAVREACAACAAEFEGTLRHVEGILAFQRARNSRPRQPRA